MAAGQGDTVKVHYTGRLDDGTEFDSSYPGGQPLEFTIGKRQLIPGFEQGVLGMEPGDMKTVRIPANQAYGPHKPEKVIEMGRNQFPADLDPEEGMRVQGTQPDGKVAQFTIVGVDESKVTLDGNHPLAGKNLTFDIELVEIL
ncbi:MAG: peptidylprolyl isomerase [Chloroflexi bacterium]|nr:peptidylprolyl isomerase [Chloroflexota bacterium]